MYENEVSLGGGEPWRLSVSLWVFKGYLEITGLISMFNSSIIADTPV